MLFINVTGAFVKITDTPYCTQSTDMYLWSAHRVESTEIRHGQWSHEKETISRIFQKGIEVYIKKFLKNIILKLKKYISVSLHPNRLHELIFSEFFFLNN